VAKREKSLVLQAEALTLLDEKAYAEAVPLLRQAVKLAPKESEGRYNLVLALLANEQPDEAITLCDASFSLFPAHLEFILAKAFAYRQKGDLDEAFVVYREILDKDKGNFTLHAHLMELALELGYTDFAKQNALYLLSLHKEEARAFETLATLEGEDSWYAKASSLMKEASTAAPEQPQEQSK
jgi:tetratricopeptide (TPR) repeat protein